MTQVVIDPATHAAIQAVKADVAAISKGIKSVQRGTTSVNGTVNVTISPVDPSKTFVNLLSYNVTNNGTATSGSGQLSLTSSTNLLVGAYSSVGSSYAVWEVVEWY